jgi:chemotaxis protein MotB
VTRRSRRKPRANHERWLVSYADFITLLFAFFVVMYSASHVDKKKMQKLSVAIEGGFQQLGVFQAQRLAPATGRNPQVASNDPNQGTSAGFPEIKRLSEQGSAGRNPRIAPENANLDELKRDLEKALEKEIREGEITLRSGEEGLIISLSEIGFFDSGSSHLRKAAEPSFGRIAALLAARKYNLRIEGHTDNQPIRTTQFDSNWDLSAARATETVKVLISRYELDPLSLSAAGYGEYHPVADNSTIEGRRQNRRVDLVILAPRAPETTPREPSPHLAQSANP